MARRSRAKLSFSEEKVKEGRPKKLQEVKVAIADDWLSIKADLNEAWEPLNDDDMKTVNSANQIANCRELNSRWVFRQTPSLDLFVTTGKILGNPGQYGVVREGLVKEGKLKGLKVAVKIVAKWKYKAPKITRSFFEDLRNEVRLIRASHEHPNVVKVYKVFEDIENLYIIMEHCSGGELFDQITSDGVGTANFNEAKASKIMSQVIASTHHIHTLGVVHCDLKPENFIFTDQTAKATLKLIDFGMAKIVHWRTYHKRMNGTPYYIAPEVLSGSYNKSCDMWSIGVILFILIFGFPPFYDNTNSPDREKGEIIIYKMVKRGFSPRVRSGYGPWFPKAQPVSTSVKDLIARLLRTDVASRMTSDEALAHPWITTAITGGKLTSPIDPDVVKSIKYFARNCQLQSEILLVLKGCKYLNQHQEDAVKKTFEAIDVDKTGRISQEDLYQALHKVDPELTREDCLSIMVSVDANSKGVLHYDDLLSSRINRKLISKEERLRKVFRALDQNGNKTLTPEDIQGALMSVHKNITLDQCKLLVDDAETNREGVIDYEEWLLFFI